MINDNTILSSFDDRPTLLEWLKKVEDALKTDTATAVSVENPSVNTYVFKITFADGETISSGNVVFPDSVKDVSIKNGHIIVTQISGTQTDLGVINPYADTIVVNAETNTTEIGNNTQVSGDLSVQGSVVGRGIVTSIGRLTANNGIEVHGQGYVNGNLGVTGNATIGGRLQTDSSIIANGEIRGGNISGTKFLLGTEEMPLVKANPTGEATQTLEKVKIGDVAYKVAVIKTASYTINKAKMSYTSGSGTISYDKETEQALTAWFSSAESDSQNGRKIVGAKIIITLMDGSSLNLDALYQNDSPMTASSLTATIPYFQVVPSIQTISFYASFDAIGTSLDEMFARVYDGLTSITYEIAYLK